MRLKNNQVLLTGVLLLSLTGCPPKAPHVVTLPTPPSPQPPTVAKTFGEITYRGQGLLLIQYKSIVVLTDPGASTGDSLPYVDYLLLTDDSLPSLGLRKDLKIIAPANTVRALTQQGFTQPKALAKGQRLMLKKDNDFLFVTGVRNGYLLEFDNGRNIFVAGDGVDEPSIREFVYELRDDGKEINLALVNGSAGAEMCGMMIGLLQPQAAYVLQGTEEATLKAKLQEEMYSGQIHIPRPGEKIYF